MILERSLSAYILIYLIIPAVFLYKLKLTNRHEIYLSKDNTESLRGIAITAIVIHHLVSGIKNQGLLTPFIGIGYLGVSIFFFLSGYGLTFSFLNRADYLENFFSERITKIFMPVILLNIVHFFINNLAFGVKYTLTDFLFISLGIRLIDGIMWYINTLFLWYVVFYVLFNYFKINTAEKLIFIAAFFYFIVCNQINLDKYWYDTAFTFPMGVLFCLKKDYFISLIKKYYKHLALILPCLFAVLFIVNQGKTSFAALSIRAMASMIFVLIICLFMYKVDISGNKVLSFLGSFSFEIYLIHTKLLQFRIISSGNVINIINITFYLMLTIFLAFFIHKFNLIASAYINSLFRRPGKVMLWFPKG